ncbi:uncharacterized protein J7T54_006036 [Emericellopsis cladophorae]|uniref:Major facilitator superfamily (MFS) profile domain-containing protein n=1 Tax=Emericellopsis cladophorae TaxID=2686198 RepID=A0A9Q0BH49_9HYPO|nr:uncharacterized protein J7T54_006036 [Emericellopsis cladophorae]KAI6785702.1 hypothetical protein J7T54_006036 [Emericellopsis cladophorae]
MQAIAPLFFGDLSDQIGRRPVYMMTFSIYIGANVGLALQNNYAALMVLGAMQSTGSSATVAIGSAVIGDLTTSADRGRYMAAVQASVQFAPALAPVIGGLLSQYLRWRSTFGFLVILTGLFLLTARKVVGNGSVPPPRMSNSLISARLHRKRAASNTNPESSPRQQTAGPAKLPRKIPIPNIWAAVRIVFEKDVGPLMIFMSLFVMANYAMIFPLQDDVRRRYDFNDVQVGLCFIPFAIGSVLGTLVMGRVLSWHYNRVAKRIGVSPDRRKGDDVRNFPIEKARLDIIWPCLALILAAIASWGWVIDAGTILAAPLVVLFFAGFGLAGLITILLTLMIDLYPMNPGRVSSCFNLTRASYSAVSTAVVLYMIDAWGYDWTYVSMASIVLAASPVIWMVRTRGPKWREERYQRFQSRQQE